jgi:hypothetical protein
MIKKFIAASISLLLLSSLVIAAEPIRIDDPERSSEEIMEDFAQQRILEAAKKLADFVGSPEQQSSIAATLEFLKGKQILYHKKVIDKDFNGALRQIIQYSYVKDVGFVYFRFNYKQSGTGWIMANFLFQTETMELFPPTFQNNY